MNYIWNYLKGTESEKDGIFEDCKRKSSYMLDTLDYMSHDASLSGRGEMANCLDNNGFREQATAIFIFCVFTPRILYFFINQGSFSTMTTL